MSDLAGTIEVHPVDLGRDVVAQRQPDGRLIIAFRPHPAQSYGHAVERTREAIEKACNRPVSADVVRRLLRPHWPEGARGDEQSLFDDDATRAAHPPDVVMDPPPPISFTAPLRRRRVQMWTAGAATALVALGGLAGMMWNPAHSHQDPAAVTLPPFEGPIFDLFEAHGGNCRQSGPGHGTCIDVDGVSLAGTSFAGASASLYNFYYQGGQRVSFVLHDSMENARLSARAEGPNNPGPAYLIGTTLISGHDVDKVTRYAKIVADELGEPVLSFDRGGPSSPATIVYEPPAPAA